MDRTEMKCDEDVLKSLVGSDCDQEMNDAILEHVERCQSCQRKLDSLAADEQVWDRAGRALKRKDKCSTWHDSEEELLANQLCIASDHSPQWTEAMAKLLLSPPSHPEMLGRIGRYEVERLVGSGGMGIVFKAFDTELNRPVAIKLLAPHLARSQSARDRFAREARAAAGIVDDHVVPIHNVDSEAESPFLVMQYVAGGSLHERLRRDSELTLCEILRIGLQTARGLAAAHSQGLIHRDVKPSNVLLDEDVARAMLTDFGLARADDDQKLTQSGFHPGTPQFMSPEQVRGDEIDGRSDLFSLGCLLHALCTGEPPFCGNGSYATLRLVTDAKAPSIRENRPDLPDWLDQIVLKLLEKEPRERFQSAIEVADLLASCLVHARNPVSSSLPIELQQCSKLSTGIPRKWWLVAAGFVPFALLLAAVTIVIDWKKKTVTVSVDGIPVEVNDMGGDAEGANSVHNNRTPKEQSAPLNTAENDGSVAVILLMNIEEFNNGNRLQEAAAMNALSELRDQDYLGYLTCINGKSRWMWGGEHGMSRTKDDDKVRLAELIQEAEVGGLREFDEPLAIALAAFDKVYAREQRLIVLTDGESKLRNPGVLDRFKQKGIKVDVVHADVHNSEYGAALQLMARQTEGQYTRVMPDDASKTVPVAFAQRTRDCIAALSTPKPYQATWDSLKKIGIGFHNFLSQHNKFPDIKNFRVGADSGEARTPHPFSWRVAILPYLGEHELYAMYRFDEPWDSDWNSTLIEKIPSVYVPRRTNDTSVGETHLMRIATLDGALGAGDDPGSFRDEFANNVLVVEAGQSVPWTKPEDLRSALTPFEVNALHFLMADGRVDKMEPIDRRQLRKMLSKPDENASGVATGVSDAPDSAADFLETVRRDVNLLWGALDRYADDHDGTTPTSLDDLVPRYLRKLPRDPFATQASAEEPSNKHFRTSANGYGYRYSQGVGSSWIISSAGPTEGRYVAELRESPSGKTASFSFYRSKGTWVSGRQPTGTAKTTATVKSGASDLVDAKLLSLPDLSKIIGDTTLLYQGSAGGFHFIRVPDVGFYRLRAEDVTIPAHGAHCDGSGKLGMTWSKLRIEGGKLVAPEAASGSF